jgi:hypothetical protein
MTAAPNAGSSGINQMLSRKTIQFPVSSLQFRVASSVASFPLCPLWKPELET